jgi:carbonic anhydrase
MLFSTPSSSFLFALVHTHTQDLLHNIFQQNCMGRHQSPISIHSRRAIPSAMPALEFIYYHNPLPAPLTIHNNGHSVSLQMPKLLNSSQQPFIFGAKLRGEYEYFSLHFHWGDKNSRGAEHVLNDIRHPLEMHIIHINRKYRSIDEALENKDGLAVLGKRKRGWESD